MVVPEMRVSSEILHDLLFFLNMWWYAMGFAAVHCVATMPRTHTRIGTFMGHGANGSARYHRQ